MTNLKLNFYEFETLGKNRYIYDNCKGVIIPSSQEISYVINNFHKEENVVIKELKKNFHTDEDKTLRIYDYIKDLSKMGCFFRTNLTVIFEKQLFYNDILDVPVSNLILILTEDCNMRCKYCIYSEHYPKIKSYSKKEMNSKTALDALEKYIKFCKKKKKRGVTSKANITFYGGEPFLKFDIIKLVIEYCKANNFDVKFSITTNGTILNDEIVDFIIKNEINVGFSLDGNKENHDRNRLLIDNDFTFNIIYKNIKKLQKKKYNKGIKNQPILFMVTMDRHTNIEKIIDFFNENHELFSPYNIKYNSVGNFGTSYYDNFDPKNDILTKSFNNLSKKVYDLFKNDTKNSMSYALAELYSNFFQVNHKEKFTVLNNKELCIPGTKIAVAPNGNLYACEKMNQKYSIGTVNSGLCLEKINKIVNKFTKIVNENCKNCNISRLCDMCYYHTIYSGDDLCFDKNVCKNFRFSIKKSLMLSYSLLEQNEKLAKEVFVI